MSDTEGTQVSYTVKELLARIEGKIDLVSVAMALKADAATVVDINRRVTEIERRLEPGQDLVAEFRTVQSDVKLLKEGAVAAVALASYRRWLFGGGLIAAGALALEIYRFIHPI